MSKTTIVCTWLAAHALIACATGGQSGSGEQADAPMSTGKYDAGVQSSFDAPKQPTDGPTTSNDAQVSQIPDAGSSGPFCTANAQCTTAGQCCLLLTNPGFCTTGTIVLGICTPFT